MSAADVHFDGYGDEGASSYAATFVRFLKVTS